MYFLINWGNMGHYETELKQPFKSVTLVMYVQAHIF